MDDIQLAYSASQEIGRLYEAGKSFSKAAPAHALSFLRGLASAFCDSLDRDFASQEELAFKIKSLDGRGLLKTPALRYLRTLQRNGNKAAHPERFDFQSLDFSALADEGIQAALGLIECLYQYRREPVPQYEVVEVEADVLKDMCFRAMIECDIQAIHQSGMYFKERAGQLLKKDNDIIVDGYGYTFSARLDIEKAMFWFKQGADLRHPDCMYQYGYYKAKYRGEDKQIIGEGERFVAFAAEAGHADAQVFVAEASLFGSGIFVKDEVYARECYELAAKQGHPAALSQLGAMYAAGIGCERDDAIAAEYCIRAAELGYPHGQYNLFVLYHEGQGVEKDEAKALKWLIEAANQDYPNAVYNLACKIQGGAFPERPLRDCLDYFKKSLAFPEFRARAAQSCAEVILHLEDNPTGWAEAAHLLQLCFETISNEGDKYNLRPWCIAKSKVAVGKLRDYIGRPGAEKSFGINELLLCTLFDRDCIPLPDKQARLAQFAGILHEPDAKNSGVLYLMREGCITAPVPQQRVTPPLALPTLGSRAPGRNDPCPCGSGRKYKKCHGL